MKINVCLIRERETDRIADCGMGIDEQHDDVIFRRGQGMAENQRGREIDAFVGHARLLAFEARLSLLENKSVLCGGPHPQLPQPKKQESNAAALSGSAHLEFQMGTRITRLSEAVTYSNRDRSFASA